MDNIKLFRTLTLAIKALEICDRNTFLHSSALAAVRESRDELLKSADAKTMVEFTRV